MSRDKDKSLENNVSRDTQDMAIRAKYEPNFLLYFYRIRAKILGKTNKALEQAYFFKKILIRLRKIAIRQEKLSLGPGL